MVRRALISVSDKTGIADFAKALSELNIDILSTGGTAKLLREHNIPVTDVSDYTGFPEIMGGRVKTLHPKIYGGLLGRRGVDETVMSENNIEPIDLLIVNLYPFQQTINQPGCDFATAIENIDIGGPAMLRAAAKNHADVGVVVDINDYDMIINELKSGGALTDKTRKQLAKKAFAHTAQYDTAINQYFSEQFDDSLFPETISFQYQKEQDLRYGENPHQKAAFYRESVSPFTQLQGKELSFNNINDADAALECVNAFNKETPACVIVKHANPCGVALADSIMDAYLRAFEVDKTSAFGGVLAFNKTMDSKTAKTIIDNQFAEVIIAPDFEKDCLSIFSDKPNIRLLKCSNLKPTLDLKKVTGGLLVQDADTAEINKSDLKTVTKRAPSDQEIQDLLFAWKVVKFVKSNAIVYAKNNQTIGIGAGQMSRVVSSRVAGIKAADAGFDVNGTVMASDAFFPFRDSIDEAAKIGITAIIQPGGSMRDEEVIKAADEANIAMVFTGIRHFRH